MDTCFLFTRDLDDTGCTCLKLNQEGNILSLPVFQTFEQIRALQAECKTIIVEATENTTLLELELPWLSEMKARVAIPYALEDKLAQSLDELHFAFDKQRYHNKHYLVTVISKVRILFLMQKLSDEAIEYDMLTTDWFALAPNELVITGQVLLVNSVTFKGALTDDLALHYLKSNASTIALLFEDSALPISEPKANEHSYVWIAQSLLKSKPLNLCQGSMQHGNASDWIKKGYTLAAILGGIWLLSLLLVNGFSMYSLAKKTAALDKQIETIYHQFFPDAKQVISPKFRISQLLGSNDKTSNQARFWFLLNQFTKGMQGKTATIEQLRFQNKTLMVTIVSLDFASLETLETQLRNNQLNVKQTQASTRDKRVVATLEIT